MALLFQFGIIVAVSFAGEVLNHIVPLPVPASIWGMIIMFLLLFTKIIKLNQVEKAADYMLSIMSVLFVPVGAGLMESFPYVKNEIMAIIAIIIISTLVCFFVTGRTAEAIISISKRGDKE
ncbi:MAG: CidA/LrgA family protein [Lachnospiraceae bacterium]|nr:CidA/LrgA family protein [Lachnospiraceae bacterium]